MEYQMYLLINTTNQYTYLGISWHFILLFNIFIE